MTGAVWEDARVRRGMGRQLEQRGRLLSEGAQPRGWKLGLGAPAALRETGLDGPLVGFFTDRTVLTPASELNLDGLANPVLEPEIAISIGADPGPDPTPEQAERAIAGLRPALELADLDTALFADPEQVLAGDLFHRLMIYGDDDRPGAEVGDVAVAPEGAPDATPAPDQVAIVAYLARYLAAFGLSLSPGDTVMGGSIGAPVPVGPGSLVRFEYGGLGEIAVRTRT